MTAIRTIASLLVAVMLATIVWGVAQGGFGSDGSAIWGLPWGKVTLIDLYAAFTLAWAWIAWREGGLLRAAIWLVLVATLGSLAIAGYVLIAARSADDIPQLLLGRHARQDPPSAAEG